VPGFDALRKISWFLIPGVELAKQQHQVLVDALPPVKIQFMTGASGVDKWSCQEVWDKIMESAVIISTHQVYFSNRSLVLRTEP
jgi:uncharacterized protein YlzI (FlbEa/FlbD family)